MKALKYTAIRRIMNAMYWFSRLFYILEFVTKNCLTCKKLIFIRILFTCAMGRVVRLVVLACQNCSQKNCCNSQSAFATMILFSGAAVLPFVGQLGSFPWAEFFQKICENIRSDSSIRRAGSWFYATPRRWRAERIRKSKKSYIKTCFLHNLIYKNLNYFSNFFNYGRR